MKTITKLTFFFILLIPYTIFAQQPTLRDSLLDCMTGEWVLKGKIAGSETVHDIKAEWVLAHQYVRLHEISREKDVKGEAAYEAEVYVGWDQSTSEYICIWIDIWGGVSAQSVGRAKPNGNEIAFLFRDKNEKIGFHTTFIYDKSIDAWQWLMDNDENGKLQPFARVKLTRK
jgi:hypothetical protein